MKKCMFLFFLAAWFSIVLASDVTINVENSWARETPPAATTGAAYLTLANTGSETDKLINISSGIAETIELHTTLHKDGVMKMRRVEVVEVRPGESTVFKPGGLHIMLMGLRQPLKKDQTFPLTLEFEKAGDITVEVTVKSIDAM